MDGLEPTLCFPFALHYSNGGPKKNKTWFESIHLGGVSLSSITHLSELLGQVFAAAQAANTLANCEVTMKGEELCSTMKTHHSMLL